ncbi:unnamed protein product [Durusdinium trenchii]|uniref:SAC domain-containing protein n=1 Tax=Durusdinium trenchii TaxID=1381693 RepID=A0ABP0KIN7_9DINO
MDASRPGVMRSRPSPSRWLVHSARSLLVVRDHPDSRPAPQDHEFLGISKTGVAREGKDTSEGLQQKLVDLAAGEPEACLAVLGLITIHQEYFLLVVIEAEQIELDDQRAFRVQKAQAIPFAGETSSGEARDALAGVLTLLEDHFYFSHDFDITRRLQRRVTVQASQLHHHVLSAADPRFVWNSGLCTSLLGQGIGERWFTPVMQGAWGRAAFWSSGRSGPLDSCCVFSARGPAPL